VFLSKRRLVYTERAAGSCRQPFLSVNSIKGSFVQTFQMLLRSNYKSTLAFVAITLFGLSNLLLAKVIGTNTPAQSITRARIEKLPIAQRGPWLGYLERSERQHKADKDAFQAELQHAGIATPTEPPHGSGARSMPLDRESEWYASADALRIADSIVSFQTPAGGWGKNFDLSKGPRLPGERYAPNNVSRFLSPDDFDVPKDPGWNYIGTIDNNATITQIEFLARVISAKGVAKNSPYLASFLRGVHYLLAAQFPNGGWPQVWPLEGGYHDAITYNDNAMVQVMQIMRNVADGRDEYAFVSVAVRAQAGAAFEHALECVLMTQLTSTGKLTVWAQQYDALTLKPTSARDYEMPAECSSESDDVLIMLMDDLPNPNVREQRAIRSAAAWFKSTAIYGQTYGATANGRGLTPTPGAGPIWARYYQIETDKPIFGDRDKSIHDDLYELSSERRNGYGWFGSEPQVALDRFEKWSQQHPESK
jgi:PelA/Pel-15E family pectate lyase